MHRRRFFFSVGSVILDDIVFPDGRTRMGVLGGGSTHAAMGMRCWSETVGLAAAVGDNFPDLARAQLAAAFDLQGLLARPVPTPRAWQVYEPDGRRIEVFRTSFEEFLSIDPMPHELPEAYHAAAGCHLHCATPEPLGTWVEYLRRTGCELILWEPWDIFCTPENRLVFRELFHSLGVDVFSPNLAEARSLTGLKEPQQIVQVLLSDGARNVALRMGAEGSLVAGAGGEIYQIPAVPVPQVVDLTGAGNAYCGGFLVGLSETGNLRWAGLYGAVSASLSLEQFGAVTPVEGLKEKARHRLASIQELPAHL